LRIQNIVGESTALTDPARNPSKTKITMLRGRAVAGLSRPEGNEDQPGHSATAAVSQTNLFFIPSPLQHEHNVQTLKTDVVPDFAQFEADTFCCSAIASASWS
jgi:hypothetical protein